jgi:hypothetical protein
MDLEKLYENIVLRDLLQYLTPGSVLLLGLCVFLEAVLKRLDAKIPYSQFSMAVPLALS